jgi:hypothetical protein
MANYVSADDDDEDDNYNYIYDIEEESTTKYNIVLCELYNKLIHGIPPLKSDVKNHYLVTYRFKQFKLKNIENISYDIITEYAYLENQTHPIFKNYKFIISQPQFIKPEIAQCIYLPDNEFVAIIKTYWIRLIQRKWKNICKERQIILKKRCTTTSIMYRELRGTWPQDCLYYPSLRGMLSSIV